MSGSRGKSLRGILSVISSVLVSFTVHYFVNMVIEVLVHD